jgi:hypothetical protein
MFYAIRLCCEVLSRLRALQSHVQIATRYRFLRTAVLGGAMTFVVTCPP